MADKVVKTEAEWREQLTPTQYAVTREKATERPFTGEYDKVTTPGTYKCIGCGEILFESDAKFDAGCGWPSFSKPAVEFEHHRRGRPQPRHGAHGSALFQMRLASGSRLQRRPRPHGPALLHQFGVAETRSEEITFSAAVAELRPRSLRPWRTAPDRSSRPDAAAFSSSCSGRLAPTMAEATFGSRSTQASANCDSVQPASCASGFSFCTASSISRPHPALDELAHRIAGGARVARRRPRPGRYLPDSTPCASGDQTICETSLSRAERDDLLLGPAPEQRILRLAGDEMLDARNARTPPRSAAATIR